MQVVPFERGHVADVTRLVNAQIAFVPPYWTLSEAQVWDILQKESLWEIHYQDEEAPDWTWRNETLCVIEGERVLAAARFDHRYEDGRLVMASARWMVGDVDHPEALGMLVDTLKAKRGQDAVKIHVNGRSDFGLGWGGVPTTDGHVMRVLAEKEFVPFQKWLIMTADINAIEPQRRRESRDHTELRWKIDVSRLEWHVEVYDGKVMAGECQSWGIPPEFAACDGYDVWMEIEWLGVEEAYQRRGLGRWMMQEQLGYHAAKGVKHCLLYTEVDNFRAQALDFSLGFQVEAEVWGWLWETRYSST